MQLASRKKQLPTRSFVSNLQNAFPTRKITFQPVQKELATRKFIFIKSQLATPNSQLATRKL